MKTTSDNGVWGLFKSKNYILILNSINRALGETSAGLILAHSHIVVIYEMVLLSLGPILSAMRDYCYLMCI